MALDTETRFLKACSGNTAILKSQDKEDVLIELLTISRYTGGREHQHRGISFADESAEYKSLSRSTIRAKWFERPRFYSTLSSYKMAR